MANSAQNKAIHAGDAKKRGTSTGHMPSAKSYSGGPVKYNEKTDKYDVHCAYCDKSVGSFAGADHAREAYSEHKESHAD